jgi:hypothetical protein
VTRAAINPVIFAGNQLNELVNSHGAFSFSANIRYPFEVFTRFHEHWGLDLIQQVDGLDDEMSRVWHHKESNSYFLLRDVACSDQKRCHECHSRVVITSVTHEGLAMAMQIYVGIEEEHINQMLSDLYEEGESR